MDEKNFINQKALSGYVVCFAEQCPLHDDCLRWKAGQQMPADLVSCLCVNLRSEKAATEECNMFESVKKQRFARGMTRIFTADMPPKVTAAVRNALIKKYNRTYFFEYRNGTRLIPPAMQQEIRDLFLRAGWQQEVLFDEYVEDFGTE